MFNFKTLKHNNIEELKILTTKNHLTFGLSNKKQTTVSSINRYKYIYFFTNWRNIFDYIEPHKFR